MHGTSFTSDRTIDNGQNYQLVYFLVFQVFLCQVSQFVRYGLILIFDASRTDIESYRRTY